MARFSLLGPSRSSEGVESKKVSKWASQNTLSEVAPQDGLWASLGGETAGHISFLCDSVGHLLFLRRCEVVFFKFISLRETEIA